MHLNKWCRLFTFSVFQVKKAFEFAYSILTNVVHPLSSLNDCLRQSILGRIVRVSDRVVQHRRRIEEGCRALSTLPVSPLVVVPVVQPVSAMKSPRSSSTGSTSSAEESGASSEASDRPSRDHSPNVTTSYVPGRQHHYGSSTTANNNRKGWRGNRRYDNAATSQLVAHHNNSVNNSNNHHHQSYGTAGRVSNNPTSSLTKRKKHQERPQ